METGRLEAALADAEEALFLRNQPGKRIQYVLADETTGSFLATLFDRIPAASMGIVTQGTGQTQTDEPGRAKRIFIDCDSKTWRHVHAYGRCGVIPNGLQPTLLAQACQWSIQPLVEALEARIPGITRYERKEETGGFTARMHFVGLDLHSSGAMELDVVGDKKNKEIWSIKVNDRGIWCYLRQCASEEPHNRAVSLSIVIKDEVISRPIIRTHSRKGRILAIRRETTAPIGAGAGQVGAFQEGRSCQRPLRARLGALCLTLRLRSEAEI